LLTIALPTSKTKTIDRYPFCSTVQSRIEYAREKVGINLCVVKKEVSSGAGRRGKK
jgi:hypothetical protein